MIIHSLERTSILKRLRPQIVKLVEIFEKETGLTVEFAQLKNDTKVLAEYCFEQPTRPIVYLGEKWEDVDIAHELMHGKIELVEKFNVLSWRHPEAEVGQDIMEVVSLIRSHVDDVIVHEHLHDMGLKIDGEIIRPQLLDDVCTKVPKYLKNNCSRRNDGMSHLDEFGYGDLRRSCFLVTSELISKMYGDNLSKEHLIKIEDFVDTFRKHRERESRKADKILQLFEKFNPLYPDEHCQILWEWAKAEKLETIVGPTSYERKNSGY